MKTVTIEAAVKIKGKTTVYSNTFLEAEFPPMKIIDYYSKFHGKGEVEIINIEGSCIYWSLKHKKIIINNI